MHKCITILFLRRLCLKHVSFITRGQNRKLIKTNQKLKNRSQGPMSVKTVLSVGLLNKALDENSSLSYGARHLPYGVTQCYLPPDTSERAPP